MIAQVLKISPKWPLAPAVAAGLGAFLVAFFVGGLTACGVKPSGESFPTDIATNMDESSPVFERALYFREGNLIGKGVCQAGSQLLDRAHCGNGIHFVPAGFFQDEMYARNGSRMDEFTVRVSEHQTAIGRVDMRLVELISVTPTPINPQLKIDIATKESAVADSLEKIAALADQLTRIASELKRQEDPELRKQFVEVQASLANLESTKSNLFQELNDLRRKFIEANSSIIDHATWDILQSQRANHVQLFDAARIELDRELQWRIAASRVLNFISDEGFVYEFIDARAGELSRAIGKIAQSFEAARIRYSEFGAVPVSHQMSFDLVVTRSGPMESFKCDLAWSASSECMKLRLSNQGLDFTVEIPQTKFEVSSARVTVPELHRFLGADVKGAWRISAYCMNSAATLTKNDCKITLK